jgi:hypothetical protein
MNELFAIIISIIALEFFSLILFSIIKKRRILEFKAVEYLRTGNESSFGKFKPTPFGLYWNSSNYFVNGIRQTNSQGYRCSNEIFYGEKNGSFRILVIGSSTVYADHFSLDAKTAWPYQLEVVMKSYGFSDIEVINAGLNYATSAEVLSHMVFHGIHLKPDLVILDGPGNDFLPIANYDFTRDYSQTRTSLNLLPRRGDKLLLHLHIFRLLYLYLVSTKKLIQMEPNRYVQENTNANINLINSEPKIFEDNVTTLTKLLKGSNIPLLLIDFLRPSITRMSELHPVISTGLVVFDRRTSDTFARISENFNVWHLKTNDFCFPDEAFHDSCHLKIEFETKKAKIVSDKLFEWQLVPR